MDAIALITATMQRICAHGFNPNHAPWEHKVCVMLHAAQGIIDNGGFEYFFEAPFEGHPAPDDFPNVFEAVGAHTSAAALRASEPLRRAAPLSCDTQQRPLNPSVGARTIRQRVYCAKRGS